jgi:hypothetical protein
MAHIFELQPSIEFYKHRVLQAIRNGNSRKSARSLRPIAAQACLLRTGRSDAHACLRASHPSRPSRQAVWFYLCSPGLIALHQHLLSSGVKVSPITHPEYMPTGEIRLQDADGYALLIGQAG